MVVIITHMRSPPVEIPAICHKIQCDGYPFVYDFVQFEFRDGTSVSGGIQLSLAGKDSSRLRRPCMVSAEVPEDGDVVVHLRKRQGGVSYAIHVVPGADQFAYADHEQANESHSDRTT